MKTKKKEYVVNGNYWIEVTEQMPTVIKHERINSEQNCMRGVANVEGTASSRASQLPERANGLPANTPSELRTISPTMLSLLIWPYPLIPMRITMNAFACFPLAPFVS